MASPAANANASSPTTPTVASRIRAASITLMEASPPPGMWAATGTTAIRAPSLADIRRGSYGSEGWNEQTQRNRANSLTEETGRPSAPRRALTAKGQVIEPFPTLAEEDAKRTTKSDDNDKKAISGVEPTPSSDMTSKIGESPMRPKRTPSGHYANGYVPPTKLPWKQSFAIGLRGFWKWFLTPSGFLITLYGLNVVAWGGMLFLLLCNASPAMCHPSCGDITSPRRKWIEVDSQVLNALFCVTGFGLAPWRFRDLYWWGWWRLGGSHRTEVGIRRLAGIHRGWFRLPGSDQLPDEADATTVSPEDPAVPIPVKTIPDPPPTAIRAPPTKSWKMDFVVWNNVWNTFFQIVLCFFMYHYNRYTRPSWATGTFVALGCIVAGIAGIMMWREGKSINKIEGVPRKDNEELLADPEAHPQNVLLVSTEKAAKPQ